MAESGIIPKASGQAIWDGGKKAMEALKVDPAEQGPELVVGQELIDLLGTTSRPATFSASSGP